VLDLTGHAIGGPNNTASNAPNFVDTLNFQSGTLQNVGQLNGGNDFVKAGSGTLTLDGTNTFTGATVVSNGTLAVAGKIGGTNSLRVLAGATLTGRGLIAGPVTVSGTLSPGMGGVGPLHVGNSLTLMFGSQTQIQLDAVLHTNNCVLDLDRVTYSGALVVTVSAGAPAAGDRFVLFRANQYSGIFSTISLPALKPGLTWANHLAEDGSISVIGPATPARISGLRLSGTNLIATGDGGLHNGPYQLMLSTNIALPFESWTPVLTNAFDADGQFSNTLPLLPELPSVYLLIKQ
jgi:autotransporter-associated beta strand protein